MPTKRSKLQIASIAGFKFDNDSKRLAHKVFRVAQTRLSLSGDVSLVILDSDECWRLNKKYRHKDYSPDVLTFVYEEDLLGEIVVNKSFILARNGKMNKLKFIRLFVHGLVHLSGLDHEEITQKEHFFLVEANILGDITEKFLDKIRKNSEF